MRRSVRLIEMSEKKLVEKKKKREKIIVGLNDEEN